MKLKWFICFLGIAGFGGADGKTHPYVFMTQELVQRARLMADDPEFVHVKTNCIQEAEAADLSALPVFENNWWKKELKKPFIDRSAELCSQKVRVVPRKFSEPALAAARAYILTGDVAYLEKSKALLLALSKNPIKGLGPLFAGTGLHLCVSNLSALEAYDLIYEKCSLDERVLLDRYFYAVLAEVLANDDYWIEHEIGGPVNNHHGARALYMMAMGYFYDLPELIDRALYGIKKFDYMLTLGVDDGEIWKEGSLPYGFVQLRSMLEMAMLSRNAGAKIDLYTYRTADGKSVKHFFDASPNLFFPSGNMLNVGDGYGLNHPITRMSFYDTLYSFFGEDRYAWILALDGYERTADALFQGARKRPKGIPPKPPIVTRLWQEHGMFAARLQEGTNYWDGTGWSLNGLFGNYVVHHHADALSITLFGDKTLWLRDCEARVPADVNSFSHPYNKDLNWTTLSHNTVMIDWQSQERSFADKLELIEFLNLDGVRRVTIADLKGQLYSGVRQMRSMVVRDEYVLDVFQVECDAPRDITWTTHVDAPSVVSSVESWLPHSLPQGGPWSFFKGAEAAAQLEQTYTERFEKDGAQFRIAMFCSQPVSLVKCRYPHGAAPISSAPHMRMFTINGTSAVFAAVYQKGNFAAAPVSLTMEMRERDPQEKLQVNLTVNGKPYRHYFPNLGNPYQQ